MILVSACLVGRFCRYDGRRALSRELMFDLVHQSWAAVCPEQLGGLATPRVRARLVGGDGADVLDGLARVVDLDGRDVTEAFVRGAEVVLQLARRLSIEVCCLKDRSPSCGLTPTPEKDGTLRGRGVCAALLVRNGIKVIEIKAAADSNRL